MEKDWLKDRVNNTNRVFWQRFKSTRAYKSIDTLMLYRTCYENLVNNGLPVTKGKKAKGEYNKAYLV